MKKFLLALFLGLYSFSFSQTIDIKLNDSVTYQEIVGFGAHGAMNVWWSAGPFYNDAFLNNIVNDLGLTLSRNNFHAYDETVYTNKQKAFFSALKAKAEANGEPIRFIQTVWSPPIEWKANKLVNQGTDGTTNYLLPEYYDDYAKYCTDYIKQLKTETGIDLYAFSLQNEPAFNEPYESCKYTPTTYNNLLNVAGPIFRANCPNVKLFGPEDMGSATTTAGWTGVIFNDPVTVNYLDVLAVHGYSDGVNAATGDATGWTNMYNNAASKKKQLWMTETSGYSDTWSGSNGALDLGKALYLALKFGKISGWTWWQLGENTTSSVYALMLNGNGSPTKRYYVSKNYYRYIRPGAFQIESNSPSADVAVVAFKNSGNSSFSAVKPQLTVVLLNFSSSGKIIKLSGRNIPSTMKAYRTSATENCIALPDVTTSSVSLAASSITTLVYQSTNKSPVINQPADIVVVKNKGTQTISLSNVTAGSGETQTLTVTAYADNKTLIPAITVSGSAPNYTLSYTTATDKIGTTPVTVVVRDNGSTDPLNTTVVRFNIKVIPFINAAPTITTIPNYTVGLNNKNTKQFIWLNGIGDGNDGSQTISKPVISLSDPSKIRLPFVNYISGNTYGNIEFYPDQLGSTAVTLKLQDNGGTDMGGVDTKTITFTITVVADAPALAVTDQTEELLTVYPNPASENVNIMIPEGDYNSVSIIDMTGKTIIQKPVLSSSMQIDVTAFNNGMYLVIVKGEKNILKTKMSIAR